MYNPFSLENKTVLVTGASSGIGRATAIECSRMGAKLIITGRNAERLNATFEQLEGDGHQQIAADLTDTAEIVALAKQLPPLDGAVLCAGIGLTIPVHFATKEKFEKIFNTNLFSQTELTRLLYKNKILKRGSSLVFIASIGGNTAFYSGNSVYGASKAALNSYVKFCAVEFASRQIRVNSVCPGMIETPLISRGTLTEEQLNADRNRYLLKRYGTPEEVAYGVIYLLSDASAWTTKSSIFIDGGGRITT